MERLKRIKAIAVVIFLGASFAFADVPPAGEKITDLHPEMEKLLVETIRLIHHEEYPRSLSNFERMKKELPDHPAGFFFYGATLEWISLDYKNFTFHDPFVENMSKAVELGKAYVSKEPKNPWAYFYTGAAYGFMGITMIKYGEWIKAFFDGMSGFKYLTKALEVKPDFYDAYYGVGQFHYWRSKKAKILMLFSTKDEMAQGIQELNLAVAKGKLTVIDTRNSLAGIYSMEGDYDKSTALIRESLAEFPNYLASHWNLAQNQMGKKEWAAALETFKTVDQRLHASPYTGQLAYVELETLRAICYMGLNDSTKARESIKKARDAKEPGLKSIARYSDLMAEVEKMERALKKSKN